MAIDLTTNPGGLFPRIGRFGKLLLLANQHQEALPAAFESLHDQFDETTPPGLRYVLGQIVANQLGYINVPASWLGAIQTAAQQTLLRMVAADNPARAGSIQTALAEVISQMVAAPATVKRSTVSASVATGSVGGDGTAVASATDPTGVPAELIIPEVARLECGSASSATFTGGAEQTNTLNYDWPGGSGASAAVPIVGLSSGTLLTNGGLDTYTVANVPDGWAVVTGTPGTDLASDTGTVYGTSAASLKYIAGATLTTVAQQVSLSQRTAYLCSAWVRTSGSGASGGVLSLDLDNGSGTLLADDAGTNNAAATTLSGLTAATWTLITAVFRTPRILPVTPRLRIRLTTALAGANLNIDRVLLSPMTRAYAGGPLVGIHAGATPFQTGDYWTVTTANNRGGASGNATFQALFDRLFGMSQYNLVLPSAGSPSIADSLITS